MNRLILILLLASPMANAYCQSDLNAAAKPIVEEGKRLYKSELASWYGTDLFFAKYKKMDNVGGYFSYSENEVSKCIFFSRTEDPVVIGTIIFDSTFNVESALFSMDERPFTENETDLYEMRKASMAAIVADTIFKVYQGTNLNLIPLISNGEKKVYVLTGPKSADVVIFGNDYLLRFDSTNSLVEKKQLHKNIIPIYLNEEKKNTDEKTIGAMHSHTEETGDYITATDICTLMLYAKFAKWKQHSVISNKYINIWNCESNTLIVVPRSILGK